MTLSFAIDRASDREVDPDRKVKPPGQAHQPGGQNQGEKNRAQANQDHPEMIGQASARPQALNFVKSELVPFPPRMPVQQGESQKDSGIPATIDHEEDTRILGLNLVDSCKHGEEQEFQRIYIKQHEEKQDAIEECGPGIL